MNVNVIHSVMGSTGSFISSKVLDVIANLLRAPLTKLLPMIVETF